MKKLVYVLVVHFIWLNLTAQGVGIGTTTPDASAALEVSSVTQGMLVPRMTSEQRNMITSPAQGLLVFDITSNTFWFRNSSGWVELVDSLHTEVHRSGPNKIYMGLNDNVGVGTTNPDVKFQVNTGNNAYGMSHTNGTVNVATFVNNQNGGWIGTKSLHPFNLYAGDGPSLLTLLPSGMVGINTPNPLYPLHLTGNSLLNGYVGIGTGANNRLDISHGSPRTEIHPTNRPLYVTGDLGADSDGIEFRHNNSTQGIGFGYNTIYAAGSNPDQDLGLNAKGDSGHLVFKTDSLERLRITGTGNVGIHTADPLYPLHVAGKMMVNDKIGIGTSSIDCPLTFSNLYEEKISFWGSPGNNFGIGVDPGLLTIHTNGAGSDIAFAADGYPYFLEHMRIKGNGKVGLGTIYPAQKLHVVGNAYVTDSISIGVSTPAQPLHVAGNASITQNLGVGLTLPSNRLDVHVGQAARTGTHASSRPLYVTGDMGANNNGIEFRHSNGTSGIGFGYNTIYATGSSANQDLNIASRGTSSIAFKAGTTELMRVMSNGNVGIGTTAPDKLFSVGNKLGVDGNGTISYKNSVNTLMYMYEGTPNTKKMVLAHSPALSDWGLEFDDGIKAFRFLKDSTPVMTVELTANRVEVNGFLGLGHTIATASVDIPGLQNGAVTCNCPVGTKVIGGGFDVNFANAVEITGSFPNTPTSWRAEMNNTGLLTATLTAYAICARIGS